MWFAGYHGFGQQCRKPFVPSREEAMLFSNELLLSMQSAGCHKIWAYHDKDVLALKLSTCRALGPLLKIHGIEVSSRPPIEEGIVYHCKFDNTTFILKNQTRKILASSGGFKRFGNYSISNVKNISEPLCKQLQSWYPIALGL